MTTPAVQQVVVLPMVVALVAAIATVLARPVDRLQRALSVASAGLYGLAVLALARSVVANGAIAYQLSDWPAPFGITLVADELAVFMLGLTAVVSLAAVAFGVVYMDDLGQRVSFHPLYHFMILGVTGSFLTGDIFNLFVWFEVMLMPSYLFVAFYSRRAETGAALEYVVLNLIGSALMLVAIGGLYATTGTLNMADMARRLANAGEFGIDPAPVLGLAAVLFAVFALKAGIVPFQFWVPGAYRAAPAPIAAVLAGVTKKVGIYAIVRLYFTVFAAGTVPGGLGGLTGQSFLAFFGPLFVLLGAASIVIGGLGAVNQADLDGVFAHSSISQVGFIVLPLGLAAAGGPLAVVGVTAALVYSLNHAVAKALLFLLSGAIYDGVGSIRFADLGGLTGRAPVLSGAFFLGGLALVGIPPLSGFFGKLLVFDTAGRTLAAGVGGGWFALAAALGGALLTIAYVSRTWSRGFWGEESDAVVAASNSRTLVAVVALLAVVLVAIGVGFDPVFRAAEGAAEAALDTGGYVDLVDPARASEVIADRTGGAGGNVTEAVGAGQPTGGLAGVIGR